MSKSYIISLCLILYYSLAFSQSSDTLYFDKLWHPCIKQDSKYYRLVQKKDSIYTIKDYYNSGILQMHAFAISLEPEILEGQCSYYHSNGNIKSAGVYLKDKQVGIWKYYNSKGKLIESYNYDIANNTNISNTKSFKKSISENDTNFSIALRGKLFGFFIIEDTYFSTATLGTEFQFKGKHSIGIDATYFGWQYEQDNSNDTALYETYERRAYLYIDYKYKFLSYKNFDFYINMYDKIGTYHLWLNGVADGYNFISKPFLNDKVDGTFNQFGIGLGLKKYLDEKGRFYFDISANGGKSFSKNNSSSYDVNQNNTNIQQNVKSNKNIFYMRLNLGYKLFVK